MIDINLATREIDVSEVITGQDLYSHIKQIWKTSPYIRYDFPIQAITPEIFQIENYTLTKQSELNIRKCGIEVRSSETTNGGIYSNNDIVTKYCSFLSLGTPDMFKDPFGTEDDIKDWWSGELVKIYDNNVDIGPSIIAFSNQSDRSLTKNLGVEELGCACYRLPGPFLEIDMLTDLEQCKKDNPEWFI